MVANNSTLNVTVVRDASSGTGGTNWTVDVTNNNLSTDTSVKDFLITHNGAVINNSNYTKNSATQITYTGAALGASTTVTVIRRTPITRLTQVTYGTKLSAANYEAELNRVHRVLAENELNGAVPSSVVTVSDTAYGVGWDGITNIAPSQNALYDIISTLVSDDAYAAGWNGVTATAPSKNAVFDEINLRAPKASPALTGTPTAPTPAQYTNTTQIATTAFVQKSQWPMFYVTVGGAQAIADATATTVTFASEQLDNASTFASNTFTAPVAGLYLVGMHLQLNLASTVFSLFYKIGAATAVRFGGTDNPSNGVGFGAGVTVLRLAASDTVVFQAQSNSSPAAARTILSGSAWGFYLGVMA